MHLRSATAPLHRSAPPAAGRAAVAPFDPDRAGHLPWVAARVLQAGRLAALAVACLGAFVLLGYALRSDRIVTLAPSLPPMYANAALGFLVGGLAVRLAGSSRPSRRNAALVGAVVLGAIGAVSLALTVADAGPTWVETLWPDRPFVAATTEVGGRPVAETCLSFLMLSVATVLVVLRRAPRAAQGAALAASTIGLAAVLGFVIGVDRATLGRSLVGIGMALHTAIGILLLGVAVLMARPDVGLVAQLTSAGPGGRLGRRLLLVATGSPVVLAALSALLLDVLSDSALAQSFLSVVQVGALGLLVMVPASAVDAYDRLAGDALRQVRSRAEAAEEHDTVVAAIADTLLAAPVAPTGWQLATRQEVAFGRLPGDSLQLLDDPGRPEFLVAVVDVAGHGSVAALQAYRLRSEGAALWRAGADPDEICTAWSRSLADLDTIATALLVAVDRTTGAFRYANAGHPAAVLARAGRLVLLPTTGALLGVGAAPPRTASGRMEHGDLLVIVTDGVTEARRRGIAPLGDDAVHALVRTWAPHGAGMVASMCLDAARDHARDRLPDDALVLVLGR